MIRSTGQDGDGLVERVFDLLIEQGCVPFMARISNFTDEEVAAGKLREASQRADEENRAFCRLILAAVAPDIAAQAKRECAEELRTALALESTRNVSAVVRQLDAIQKLQRRWAGSGRTSADGDA